MTKINVQLLGSPIVEYNERIVHFPYKKSEGLFYFICFNKSITRDEAINIFWADNNEKTAKKNLRDALYKIKKSLVEDIFTVSKSRIELNEKINITVDIDDISTSNIINAYKGDFLDNFYIKDCYEFENWVFEKRADIKNIYIKSIENKVNELVSIKDYKSIYKFSDILIKNDPYNEKIYRHLMKIYTLCGDYNKSIKLYYELYETLKKDLDIEPELDTKKMFKEILKLKEISASSNSSKPYFFGRFNELYIINKNINNFYLDSSVSMVITGEAGIGKTAILDNISNSVDKNKSIVLKASCFCTEEDFFLKPWNSIFSKLQEIIESEKIQLPLSQKKTLGYIFPNYLNIKYDVQLIEQQTNNIRLELIFEAIIDLLKKISEKKKIILIFDDIQWMDKMSILLLTSILTHFKNSNVMFLGTYRNDFEVKLSKFMIPLFNNDLLIKIELDRFTFDETKNIIKETSEDIYENEELVNTIYKDTEGNALFLIELIKVINERGYTNELSPKVSGIIESRLSNLSKEEKVLLNIISLFIDKASISSLINLVTFDELKIFDIIESLKEKNIIEEVITDNDIFFSFTHQKIREYVYNKQSYAKKKNLHEKIGLYFEDCIKSSGNKQLYPNLIYHFEKSQNLIKSFKYKIKNLTDIYTLYHETYPVFSSSSNYLVDNYDLFNVEERIEEISRELNELNSTDAEYLIIKMEISYLSGRYYISRGDYDNGLKNIENSMKIAEILDNNIYLLNNYKQIIFYCIQVNNLPVMYKYINKSLKLLDKNDNVVERGIILRLKGLYFIKKEKYDEAEQSINKSLNIFENLNKVDKKYTVSISACYNYLSQMHKDIGNFDLAIEFSKKSISICEKSLITKSLAIFYSNLGQIYYELKSIGEAELYINKSIELFDEEKTIWQRDITECYAALINIDKNCPDKAKKHYEIACYLSDKLKYPKSMELVKMIKKELNL